MLFVWVLVLAGVPGFLVIRTWLRSRNLAVVPLPPGPKGLPLIGNVGDLPPSRVPEYQHWLKLKDRYGSLNSITVLGQTMVIVHDKEIAFELMEKRAHIYSERPKMKFGFNI